MPEALSLSPATRGLPSWVPQDACTYLLHTESGIAIRALARAGGVHASTVLRQVRSLEARREDILVDKALCRLGRQVQDAGNRGGADAGPDCGTPSVERLEREARRVLRRMCERGAVLAVAAEMDRAVVVRETAHGDTTRLAVVERQIAEAMALKGWIGCDRPAHISRYHITRAGRAALNRLLAAAENRAVGFAEAQSSFEGCAAPCRVPRPRHRSAETPLALLARRHDRSGKNSCPATWCGRANGCARITRWPIWARAGAKAGMSS